MSILIKLFILQILSNKVFKFAQCFAPCISYIKMEFVKNSFTCVGTTGADIEKTRLGGGGFIPCMTNSPLTSDCRRSGKLFFKNPIRHGCGEAFNNFSSLSQNSSGSTLVSISSCIKVRTLCSTALGSRLDNSNKFAKNLRHFSLVLSVV